MSSVIETFTGVAFDLVNPDPNDVRIEDVAHALSLLCRYTGHVRTFYSVAQHSCLVSEAVGLETASSDAALVGLLHDAAEAYCADVSTPLKAVLGATYARVERRIQDAVWHGLGVSHVAVVKYRAVVKCADLRAMMTEVRDLMPNGAPWRMWDGVAEPFAERVVPWSSIKAECVFQRQYLELKGVWR